MAVLDDIIEGVRADLDERMARVSARHLTDQVPYAPAPLPVIPAFQAPGVSVIAEVKRASPSKGSLASIGDPAALAESYAAGGAAAISVLTEQRRFRGNLDDLIRVRQRVQTPLLRKDFMVTDYQLLEARVAGADLILLIVAALDDAQLRDFGQLAAELGMTALVEVHTEDEVERALAADASVIGINNRNLKTLEVDNDNFGRLAGLIPDDRIRIAESGVGGPADVVEFARAGADAVLVGEALVRGDDPQQAVRDLIAAGQSSQPVA